MRTFRVALSTLALVLSSATSVRALAFLEWLSHIHHDATVFDNEVKNGSDAELKTYAKTQSPQATTI